MTDETSAPAGGEAIAAITPATTDDQALSPREAFEAYRARRSEQGSPSQDSDAARAAMAGDAPLNESDAQAPDAAPEKVPGEAPTEAEPAEELPPLEPPRSWTKDRKEQFNALPRDLQEYVADRVQEQDREFRRSQNEIAEQRKVIDAERQKAEQARTEYEAKLPLLEKKLQTVGPFADIQSMDDLVNLQRNDPFRFQEYQLYTWQQQAEQTELRAVEARQQQEQQSKWAQHVQKENELAAEYIPDLADKVKGPALTQRAAERLTELGFKPEELNDLASGKQKLSIYDHRFQRLIFSDLKLADIQKAKAVAAAKIVPTVQKPGVAQPKGAAAAELTRDLSNKLNNSGGVDDAYALYQARKKARS